MEKFGFYLFSRLNFSGAGLFQILGARKLNELLRAGFIGREYEEKLSGFVCLHGEYLSFAGGGVHFQAFCGARGLE